MPIKVPADAKMVRDSRVTMIRVISTLYDRVVNGRDGLKARVKTALSEKGATFAESDLVVAQLRPGNTRGPISSRDAYGLVLSGQIDINDFLDSVNVSKEKLSQFIGSNALDQLTPTIDNPEPQLFTEFREGVELDIDELATSLAGSIMKAVPIKAA